MVRRLPSPHSQRGGDTRRPWRRRPADECAQLASIIEQGALERDGLVTRHVFPTKPPSVEYRLSALGRSSLTPLAGLIAWADENYAAIRQARARFDAEAEAVSAAFPAASANASGWPAIRPR
jgi:hypothetical protein